MRQADAQVLTVLAQQVEQGKVNPQAVAPSLSAERSAALAELQVDQSTLAQLHSILTPAQRNQLVDAVEARMAQGGQRWEGKGQGGGGKLGLSAQQKAEIKANLQASRPQGSRPGSAGSCASRSSRSAATRSTRARWGASSTAGCARRASRPR